MSDMQHDIDAFYDSLQNIDAILSEFASETRQTSDAMLALLEEPLKKFPLLGSDTFTKAAQEVFNGIIENWKQCFEECREKSKKRRDVQDKLDKYKDKLIVAVFGRTNSGKSTLGNFIKGRQLRNAPFPNVYKAENGQQRLLFSNIAVVELAHTADTGNRTHASTEYEWFDKGILETTKEAHAFTGPGLAWLDTPGIGSTTTDYGELTKKYVEHTDVLLYLDASDSPGLRDHVELLKRCLDRGCHVYAIINHSDRLQKLKDGNGYIKNADGSIVRGLVEKKPEVRKDQEDHEIKALREAGYNDKLHVFSTSMLMAEKAVLENAPTVAAAYWEGSNLRSVYDIFTALAAKPDELKNLKSEAARRNLRTLAGIILNGEDVDRQDRDSDGLETSHTQPEKTIGLETIHTRLEKTIDDLKAQEKAFDVDTIAKSLQEIVLSALQMAVSDFVKNAAAGGKVGKDGKTLNTDDLNARAKDIMRRAASERAKKILKDLFDAARHHTVSEVGSLSSVQLRNITEERSYFANEVESYAREPDGFFENAASFFGKKYYGYTTRQIKKTQTIDLGLNTEEMRADLNKQLHDISYTYFHAEMTQIKRCFLQKFINMLMEVKDAVTEVIEKLKAQHIGL